MLAHRSYSRAAPMALAAVGGLALSSVLAQDADVPFGYPSDRIIVKLAPGANAVAVDQLDRRGDVPIARLRPGTRNVMRSWKATSLRPVFAVPLGNRAVAQHLGLDRYYELRVPKGTDVKALAANLARLGGDIEAVGLDAIGTTAGLIPDDPDFSRQHNMHNTGVPDTGPTSDSCPDNVVWCDDADINAPEAWAISTGSPDVIIAVVDSGVFPHPEFSDRMLVGRNTVNNTTDTSDGCPHGTHVAGIALARGNDAPVPCPTAGNPNQMCGIAGVNWQAKLLPVKVLTGCNGGVIDLAEGIVWAVDNGADVINISLQFYNVSGLSLILLQDAVEYAHGLNAVVVAAAGNSNPAGVGVVAFPAQLPNVIAVGATTACDERATLSNTGWNSNSGPDVDLCAPGDDIYSTWTFDTYRCLFGTSLATPHVSGAAGLLRSVDPMLTNDQIVSILTATADDVGVVGPDEDCGFGRLNAYGAVLTAAQPCQVDADCDSGFGCTTDTCNVDIGVCVFAPDDTLCDDGVFCNGSESCDPVAGCLPGVPPECIDPVDCTIDRCDTLSDQCVNLPDDALCSDGLFCNGAEVCDPTVGCSLGPLPDCDDGDACTIDSCNTVCQHERICGACCQIGGACVDLMTEQDCENTGISMFLGIGSACMGDTDNDGFDDTCPILVPTVSEWGLAVLTLLLLVSAKLHFGTRQLRTQPPTCG